MIASGIIAQLRIGTPQAIAGLVHASAYHRQPVAGPVAVGELGLDGDQVGNRRVHGGPEKAIYAYPLSGYAGWRMTRRAAPAKSQGTATIAPGASALAVGAVMEKGSADPRAA